MMASQKPAKASRQFNKGRKSLRPEHRRKAGAAATSVKREVLYGDSSGLCNNGSSRSSQEADNSLAFLYRPSYELLYDGPFEYAKDAEVSRNKWLLLNVQSTKEFNSVMLNRDTWANEIVTQMIKSNFVFWQEDEHTEEGKKVYSYYKLHSLPVILVIDPKTGQKMRSWKGMVEPEMLLEDAMFFMDQSPSQYHANQIQKQRARRIPRDRINEITDDGEDKKQVLMKKNRDFYLPDGGRIQRNFLKTDSIKLLWSLCCTQLEEAETRPFRFTQAIPRGIKAFGM